MRYRPIFRGFIKCDQGFASGAVPLVEPDAPHPAPQSRHGASGCLQHVCAVAALLLPTLTAPDARPEDGEVRHHDVEDGPRLSEHDILGRLRRFGWI